MTLPRSDEKNRTVPEMFRRQSQSSSAVKQLGQAFEAAANQTPFTIPKPTTGKRGQNEMDTSPSTPSNKIQIVGRDDASAALLQEIRAMSSKLDAVHVKVNSTHDDTQEIKKEMGILKTQFTDLQATVEEQAKQIRFLQIENDRLHVEANSQYAVIHGIPETEHNQQDLYAEIDRLFSQGLNLKVGFDNPKRKGRNLDPSRPRPVSVYFQWPSEREQVINAARQVKIRGIYINPDLPPTMRAVARERRLQNRRNPELHVRQK